MGSHDKLSRLPHTHNVSLLRVLTELLANLLIHSVSLQSANSLEMSSRSVPSFNRYFDMARLWLEDVPDKARATAGQGYPLFDAGSS